MNGRVYDPEIGRFLSADPVIQDITDLQALNAYSYVQNNPLSLTDPTGMFSFGGLFKAIGNVFRSIGRAFLHAARAIVRSSIGRAILQIAACFYGGPVGCAAAAAGLTLASGGSISQAIMAAGFSFMQFGAYTVAHGMVAGISSMAGFAAKSAGALIVKMSVHAIIGGALAMSQGGSFTTGAITGSITAATSFSMEGGALGTSGVDDGMQLPRAVVGAVAGGTASVLSGGKFANGAITGAMQQMFNDDVCVTSGLCKPGVELTEEGLERAGSVAKFGATAAAAYYGGGLIAGAISWARGALFAEEAADLLVIGRQVDTAVAKGWPGHQVLDLPASEWSITVNDAWVQAGIDARQSFYLASPTTKSNLWNYVEGRATVYGREFKQLLDAGYRRVGDYMHPPSGP